MLKENVKGNLKNGLLAALLVLLAVVLSACAADDGVNGVNGAGDGKTAAEAYLESHSRDEILAHFEETYMFMDDFSDPEEITPENLFTFALFHERDSWYDEEDSLFYIPLADIYDILDGYLPDYNFHPEELGDFYENYDAENERFVLGAIGMGIGCVDWDLYTAEVIDADNIRVMLLQYCSDPEVGTDVDEICVTARIVDGEAKFTSCQTQDEGTALQCATAYSRIGMGRSLYQYSDFGDVELMYSTLINGIWHKVDEPKTPYGSMFEISDYYMEQYVVGFYNEAPVYEENSGENATNAVRSFVLYKMLEGEPEYDENGRHLLYDVQENEWYTFRAESFDRLEQLLNDGERDVLFSW